MSGIQIIDPIEASKVFILNYFNYINFFKLKYLNFPNISNISNILLNRLKIKPLHQYKLQLNKF